MKAILNRIFRKCRKCRLEPIPVFLFHSVSDTYDPNRNMKCDWTDMETFKSNILKLKEKYTFIPLDVAFGKISGDKFRRRRYAVLTSDDGDASVLKILPFLKQEHIPITLFLNSDYLSDKSRREDYPAGQQYISSRELKMLDPEMVSIGMHGMEHIDHSAMTLESFAEQIDKCHAELSLYEGFIPFWAYTWGRHSASMDSLLNEKGIVPVLVDGTYNCKSDGFVHRYCIDGETL